MTHALPRLRRTARLVAAVALCATPFELGAQTPTPAASSPSSGFTVLQGTITDGIHGAPLVNARVTIEGTSRFGMTTEEGRFRIDSIPPGNHRIWVTHPLLDTLGLSMRTPEFPFRAGESHTLPIAVPTGPQMAATLCTPAQRLQGPAVMTGFVRDPDTSEPVKGASVQLDYDKLDPLGRKMPVHRTAPVDSTGLYHICGIPADMDDGKAQAFIKGMTTGNVPVSVMDSSIALRAFSLGAHQTVAMVKGDSGKVTRMVYGNAKVTGRVTNKAGQPLAGARVALEGAGNVTFTKPNGEFTMDSLPSGTQSLEIRKLGYGVTYAPVELSSTAPARTSVTMEDHVQTLEAVRVEAQEDKALAALGYTQRKKESMGYFFDGKQINHESVAFTDVARIIPGVQVLPAGDGRSWVITDSRSTTGCVNYYVDNTPYVELTPGDIDQYVPPADIVAIEVYHGAETPPQFTKSSASSCMTIVIWTQAKVKTVHITAAKKSP